MKINSMDPSQPAITSEQVKPDKSLGKSDFASVLKESVQAPENNHDLTSSPVTPAMAYMAIQQPAQSPDTRKAAQGLLDTLERYQKMLADPSANMKTLDPVVDKMKKHAEDLEPIMETLPGEDPVKGVIKETMMLISKEVARFNQGEYIDR